MNDFMEEDEEIQQLKAEASRAEYESIRQELLSEIEKFDRLSRPGGIKHSGDECFVIQANKALATEGEGIAIYTKEQWENYISIRDREGPSSAASKYAYEAIHQKSMAVLLKKGEFDNGKWNIAVEKGGLPQKYKTWFPILNNDRALADQLIQAVKRAYDNWIDQRKKKDTKHKILYFVICLLSLLIAIIVFSSGHWVIGIIVTLVLLEVISLVGKGWGFI